MMKCEISGELIATSSDEAVVTPSGHICLKRLLLTKLTENGGIDPFETASQRPLAEDQLITLAASNHKDLSSKSTPSTTTHIVPPRGAANTNIPSLLSSFQTEYDALVLELFDTRAALEETRRELSQALYQNDAALRVVARMAMERDQARQQLQEWNTNHNVGGGGDDTANHTKKRKLDEAQENITTTGSALINDIPQSDFDSLEAVWKILYANRKAWQKQAAAAALSADEIKALAYNSQAWHATTCKGIVALATNVRHGPETENSKDNKMKIVTAGKDKTIMVYDPAAQQVVATLDNVHHKPICVDIYGSCVAAGFGNGTVQVWKLDNTNNNAVQSVGSIEIADAGTADDDNNDSTTTIIAALQLHPNGQHMVVTASTGKVLLIHIHDMSLEIISILEQPKDKSDAYTAGSLHPDGLVHVAGTAQGTLHLWDFKARTMAATFQDSNASNEGIVQVQVSPNGYHIASVSTDGEVRVWDMRKQKCLAVLNQNAKDNDKRLTDVTSITFDESGKYLAYGGAGGQLQVVTVKEWDVITAELSAVDGDSNNKNKTTWAGVTWTREAGLVLHSHKQRQVGFFSS